MFLVLLQFAKLKKKKKGPFNFTYLFRSKRTSVFKRLLTWGLCGTEISCIGVTFLFDGFLFLRYGPTACVPCPAGVLLPIGNRRRSALTIIFKSLSHLSTFFSANHPRLLWDVCEHPFSPTGANLPGCSSLLDKLTPSQACKCLHALLWYLMLSWAPLRPCFFCMPRDRDCEFRQLLLFSSPLWQGSIKSWILLGLIFVLFLELALVHNDNFLLNCFCCTLPVSLPFQEKWLQSKYQTSTQCIS